MVTITVMEIAYLLLFFRWITAARTTEFYAESFCCFYIKWFVPKGEEEILARVESLFAKQEESLLNVSTNITYLTSPNIGIVTAPLLKTLVQPFVSSLRRMGITAD